jgi:hypothetical protein
MISKDMLFKLLDANYIAEVKHNIDELYALIERSDNSDSAKCPNCSSESTRLVIRCDDCNYTEYGNDR